MFKTKKFNMLRWGIINVSSPFCIYVLALIAVFKILDWNIITNSVALGILFWFIFLLSPLSCILGIVQGIRGWKRGRVFAPVCLILSVIGLLIFAAVTDFLRYVLQGSWLR